MSHSWRHHQRMIEANPAVDIRTGLLNTFEWTAVLGRIIAAVKRGDQVPAPLH
jgi:hypothetical protein